MGYLLFFLGHFFSILQLSLVMQIVLGLAGRLFFVFPAIYTLARYTMVLLQEAGVDPWIAWGVGGLVALVAGFPVAFAERRLSRDSFAVLGIVAFFALYAVVLSWTSLTHGVNGVVGVQRLTGFTSLSGEVLFLALGALMMMGLSFVLLRTGLKRRWMALKEAPHLLEGIGVSAKELSLWTIVMASFFIGIVGMNDPLFYLFLDPNWGTTVAFVQGASLGILAYRPRVSSAVFAVLFVEGLPELLRFLELPASVEGSLRSVLYSVIFIGVLLVLQRKQGSSARIF